MRNPARTLPAIASGVAFLTLATPLAFGQQFQQVTNLPTIAGAAQRWDEGVECTDVDQDGDLDIFVAGGSGFNAPGVKHQNGLVVNKLIETGPFVLVDESVLRLGARVSHAKQVITGDVDGDGWVDALFANAWNTDTPFLYMNRGAAQPGFFDMESATRGFTQLMSSGGGCFGDLDDDGDLDLILGDAYFTNGRPRLFINNGTGVFTENAPALNAPIKSQQQDVQLVDIDGDWDVDFLGINRASTHYLMLNSGAATFVDSSATIPATSSSTYEADVADLDGDTDIDIFWMGLSGAGEGAMRNNVLPSATLSFTSMLPALGSFDDNEIAYIDYDNDGDYDPLVGSLGANRERLYTNNGNFAFVDSNQVQTTTDPTLDCTFVDLNNDGAYDLVTIQGESNTTPNRYYRNTGAADTLAPIVLDVLNPASPSAAGPTIVKAKIRDQVLDDGVNYVTATATYVVATGPANAGVSIDAGGVFTPSNANVAAGTTVTWTNNSGATQRVASTTAPYTFDSGSIAPGGTYAYTFVNPIAYGYANSFGGTNGQVTVGGSATTVAATHSGGQLYRFRMDDTAAGAGIQICYELRFRDWPGNETVTETMCLGFGGGPVGTAYCFGDGTLATPCPCFNLGVPGAGCDNSISTGGAVLTASGTTSPDTVVLTSSNELPSAASVFLQGSTSNASGTPFGDGVRCVAGNLKRIGVKNAVGGVATYPQGGDPSITAQSAALGDPITPGTTRFYQVYYRDPDLSFCASPTGNTFNISSGLQITW